ncbi:MAG: hypothetical protein PHG04_02950 [Candidatus Nanoarchaeia archaeon]|nr:hypothetical protein [Candidatus Nanoarchaeia archaeon]
MLLIAGFKKDLKDFAKKEIIPFCSSIIELSPSKFLINADFKKIIINSFIVESLHELVAEFSKVSDISGDIFKKFIKKNESFKVKCNEKQVCIDLGQAIKDGAECAVSLENPDKTFFAEKIDEKYYCYLAIHGAEDLSKRGYASNNNEFIPADAAKALADFSGYNDDGNLLDAFSHEGYIIIECALKLLKVGPAYFNSKNFDFEFPEPKVKPLKHKLFCSSDSMADLKFAKQNAKLSKTFKFIDFNISTLNDLDYAFKENTFDYFISALPKKISMEKLFFQLDYIMKKKCVVVILSSESIEGLFEEFGFKITNSMQLLGKKAFKLERGF